MKNQIDELDDIFEENDKQVSAGLKYGIPAAALIIAVLVIGGFVYYQLVVEDSDYSAETQTINCTLDIDTKVFKCVDDSKEEVDTSELFSEVNVQRYRKGNGFILTVTKVRKGKPEPGDPPNFEVKTFETYQEDLPSVRDPYLKVQKREFPQWLNRYKNDEPIERSVIVYVDDTAGINKQFSDYGISRITKKVQKMLATNDGVTIFMYRGGNNISEHRKSITLPMRFSVSAEKDVLWNEFVQKLTWLFEPRPAQANSALLASLFESLKDPDHADMKYRDVELFTDGLENTSGPEGTPHLSLYQRRDLVPDEKDPTAAEKWAELDGEIKKIAGDFPNLAGAAVTLHAPPAEGENGTLTKDMQKYLKNRFLKQSKAMLVDSHLGYND